MVVNTLKRQGGRFLYLLLGLTLSVTFAFQYKPQTAHADLTSCSINLSPQSVAPGSDNYLNFGIFNSSSNPIAWAQITAPTDNSFTVASASAYSWNGDTTSNQATFTTGSLPHNSSQGFSVEAIAGNTATSSPVNWTAQVSDSPDGSNPISCDGDLSMQIVVQPSIINISDVQASNLTSSSIDISWDTDTPSTSQVSYGLDSTYGTDSTVNNSLVTSHLVTLKGLSANTGYHYQVTSTTPADGGTATSGDNTFLTPIYIPTAPAAILTNKAPLNLVITNPGDKTPPTIALDTVLPRVVQSIPTIHGTAADESAVARVEYSTNKGRDWLPVDSAAGINSKTVAFAFTPSNLDDGNYTIVARAIDGGGNITATVPVSVVVDRLPPLIGGSVVSLGPQVLSNTDGKIVTQAGVDEKISLSAVGGPTSINLVTEGQDKAILPQTFGLSRSQDNGLWSGIISFKKAGTYILAANSVDGAGNKTTKQISKVTALPASQITDAKTGKPISGQVVIYTMLADANNWVVWDGAPYGQANPQPIGKDGQFSFLLPAGKYYLSASATSHHSFKTKIFELTQPGPLATTISLKPGKEFKLMSWLNMSSREIHLGALAGSKIDKTNTLVGKLTPSFSLNDLNGKSVKAVDLLGKPTDLVFMTTWAPTTSDQLPALDRLAGDNDINIKPVGAQQNAALLSAYNEISGYSLAWLADPDSTSTRSFATPSLPTHYFIDRNGTVKQVVSGVLTKQEILNELSGL